VPFIINDFIILLCNISLIKRHNQTT